MICCANLGEFTFSLTKDNWEKFKFLREYGFAFDSFEENIQ